MVKGERKLKTPGTPGLVLVKALNANAILKQDDQTTYRRGVGTLLYLVKYTRPDIANAVRELSKGMQEPTLSHMKELKRVLKFVLDTKDYGIKMEPNTEKRITLQNGEKVEWELLLFTDSDWAGDKDSRKSITGFEVFLFGCPISWKSTQQPIIALSSSEAKIYACSEAFKEIIHLIKVMKDLGLKVKLPVKVYVDNIGAIYLAKNGVVSERTKHIDIRAKYLTSYIEDNIVMVVFVKSEDNLSDCLTKNVTGEIYDKQKDAYVAERDYLNGSN